MLALGGCAEKSKEPAPEPVAAAPVLARTILLPGLAGPRDGTGIAGRIDHVAYDPVTHRLFVACVSNGSLEILDLDSGERVKSIGGLKEPEGVAVVNPAGLAVVSTGGDGRIHAFDTRTLAEKASAPAGADADNVRLAPDGAVWVSSGGEGPGGLGRFDPVTLARTGTLALPRQPESFQVDPAGTRIFANLPGQKRAATDGSVVAVEVPSGKVLWAAKLRGRARNFPMALDPGHHRVFVASRLPPRLIALDDRDGTVFGEAECAAESDDVFFDKETGRVLVIGGGALPRSDAGGGDSPEGTGAALDVFAVDPQGLVARLSSTPIPRHARTGTFVPDRRALYVAVPPLDGRPAEVREYTFQE